MRRKGAFTRPTANPATNVPYLKEVYKENGWGDLSHEEKDLTMMTLVDMWREGTGPDNFRLANAEKVIKGIIGRLA